MKKTGCSRKKTGRFFALSSLFTIFAPSENAKTSMKNRFTTHNLLNCRVSHSHVSLCNIGRTSLFRNFVTPLLYRASAFCGRAFLLLLLALPHALVGCEKDMVRYEEMVQYHAESQQLPQVAADSVARFSHKVDAFVGVHPDASDDPLYPVIQENIRQASLLFIITIDDEWAGIIYGTF